MSSKPLGTGAEARRGATLRRRVHAQLSPAGRLTPAARFLIVAILAATAMAVAETEPLVAAGRERMFAAGELFFAAIFTVEYGLRLWSAPEAGMSRLRWMRTPTAIIDLVAILGSLLPFLGANAMLLRLLRVMRMLRIAKLGRFSSAFGIMDRAVRSRASHLAVAFMMFLFFLIVAATFIYLIEGDTQPDKFGSIPRSLWWTSVTMTTVGYGDVVPATPLGKLIASFVSMGGIILIAIPTGILAASFSDEFAAEEQVRAAAAAAAAAAAEEEEGRT